MKAQIKSGEIEAGDFIISGGNYGHEFGFYRGTGRGTLQYYSVRYLSCKLENPKVNWSISFMGGNYGYKRLAKYHPDLITDQELRKEVDRAIEYIRQSKILPVKY